MKIFIASDLHGSAEYCRQLIEAFYREKADKLLLLGDILYHGPRNDLPEGYSPKEVLKRLEAVKDKVICVAGNCDAEIDRELLPFPVISDLGAIFCDGLAIYFAHGHKDVALSHGDIYISGHTHVPLKEVHEGHYHLNPGSLSLPKEGSSRGYIVYENRKFTFKHLSGDVFDELEIKEVAEPEKVKPEKEPEAEPKKETHLKRPVLRKKIVLKRK